jgi:3-oxoacyl-[acyl-carrier-protein] synthase III
MNNTIGLVWIGYKFGENIVSNESIEKDYNLPSGWVFEKTGKLQGHSWTDRKDAPVLASVECFKDFIKEKNFDKKNIKAIFGTTNPITINGITDEVSLTKKFAHIVGLKDIDIIDCSYGCGGTAIGIKEMKDWFANKPKGTYALYITQDWSTKMIEDRNVKALFSDAVCVSVWSNNDKGLCLLGDVFAIQSNIPEESLGIVDGVWRMKGRDVVEQALQVPDIVSQKLNIKLSDYDLIPHQPNAKLLETIEKKYNISLYKDIAVKHGNPTCSGALIALADRIKSSEYSNKKILVMPFGAGGIGGFILTRIFKK